MATRSKRTLGIDEAGRGPALGQMVLAAVLLDSAGARHLTRAGLADSKSYGSGKKAKATRLRLAKEVEKYALFVSVQVVDVAEVDRRVHLSELNLLEREVADKMISAAPLADRIVADGERLFKGLQSKYPHLEAVNNGESAHASVAAASVIAKTRRDELFALMQVRYSSDIGPFEGGGYVNATTKKFLADYAQKHATLPPEARRSWPYLYLDDILGPGFCPEAPAGAPEVPSDPPQAQLSLL